MNNKKISINYFNDYKNNTNNYILYMGLNDKNTKRQKIRTKKAIKYLQQYLFNNDINATISLCKGLYKHEGGQKVKENTIKIELLFIEENKILSMIEDLKKDYNQETIAVQKILVNATLI